MLSLNLFDLQPERKKNPLKTGFISLILSIIFLVGCSEDDCPPCSTPTDDRISFEMNFLDTPITIILLMKYMLIRVQS